MHLYILKMANNDDNNNWETEKHIQYINKKKNSKFRNVLYTLYIYIWNQIEQENFLKEIKMCMFSWYLHTDIVWFWFPPQNISNHFDIFLIFFVSILFLIFLKKKKWIHTKKNWTHQYFTILMKMKMWKKEEQEVINKNGFPVYVVKYYSTVFEGRKVCIY